MNELIGNLRSPVRWIISSAVVLTYLSMVANGTEVPDTFYGVVTLVMAFWFKEN